MFWSKKEPEISQTEAKLTQRLLKLKDRYAAQKEISRLTLQQFQFKVEQLEKLICAITAKYNGNIVIPKDVFESIGNNITFDLELLKDTPGDISIKLIKVDNEGKPVNS